jgi:hypothetical protein
VAVPVFLKRPNHGELFGFERTATLSSCAANTIAEAALRFGQADDITVISVVATYA